jgi:hypothetical protein
VKQIKAELESGKEPQDETTMPREGTEGMPPGGETNPPLPSERDRSPFEMRPGAPDQAPPNRDDAPAAPAPGVDNPRDRENPPAGALVDPKPPGGVSATEETEDRLNANALPPLEPARADGGSARIAPPDASLPVPPLGAAAGARVSAPGVATGGPVQAPQRKTLIGGLFGTLKDRFRR